MICGIDEAGRGCVIGPMVIAIAQINPLDEYTLKEMGIRDSKLLTPKKRGALYAKIKKMCKIKTIHLSAEQITEEMGKYSLNEIEAIVCAKLLKSAKGIDAVYIDSPDSIPKNFEKRIRKYYKEKARIICENKADRNHPIVAAASIVAKVQRDEEIEKIKKELGHDFNSGYTSDEKTIDFLKKHIADENLQKYLRHKWSTLQRLKQSTLPDY